jgi:hypothetical protein
VMPVIKAFFISLDLDTVSVYLCRLPSHGERQRPAGYGADPQFPGQLQGCGPKRRRR